MRRQVMFLLLMLNFLLLCSGNVFAGVKIGMSYPQTGNYFLLGEDEWRGAEMAMEEINASGGILGEKIEIIRRDSKTNPKIAYDNAAELVEKEGVKMLFGGASSAEASSVSKLAREKKVVFFGTLTCSDTLTDKEAHKHFFRACYNTWMYGQLVGHYLNENFKGKKFFYITADYSWGWSSEAALREITNTHDQLLHGSVKTPFPQNTAEDFGRALEKASSAKPDVLILSLFGKDVVQCLKLANVMKLKDRMQIIAVPMDLSLAESAGPEAMEGVIGSVDWSWKVPYYEKHQPGIEFVEKYANKYGRFPSWASYLAYTILYEYKSAVERAGSFDSDKVIKALEGHEFTLLKKNPSQWRDFDHQIVTESYLVRMRPAKDVKNSRFQEDYFDIIHTLPGADSVRTHDAWVEIRKGAGLPAEIED